MDDSSMKYKLSIMIFRRDLRIIDNTALIHAMGKSKKVLPIFILSTKQVTNQNKYRSSNSIQFMIESLRDLDNQIKDAGGAGLTVMFGDEIDMIDDLKNQIDIDAIFVNEDYSPYARSRDKKIQSYCKKNKIKFESYHDILLIDDMESVCAQNGNYYKNFTMFYKRAVQNDIRKIDKDIRTNFYKKILGMNVDNADKSILNEKCYTINENLAVRGGRIEALRLLKSLKGFNKYNQFRDYPSRNTTMLSAHNKFGTVSIREVHKVFSRYTQDLVKQLYWRDFYYYVCYHYPELFNYVHLHKSYTNRVKWSDNYKYFKKWKKGETGFPIVDAAMREMNTTGYMHNRCRMIVAMFLTKDLFINWKYGEKYFTKMLVDIDRCQNLGNWNWCASFGLDNASYVRIFNPWTQSHDYDKDCKYIKRWLPELVDVPNDHIHKWFKYYKDHSDIDYPAPIIDHDHGRKQFMNFYSKGLVSN